MMVILLFFSSLLFIIEPRGNLESMPSAMWLTIVTMSTVGYGDATPSTTAGHLVTGLLIVLSALYMAIPLGIVGNAFNKVWEDRDQLLLVQRGYKAKDMPTFFAVYATCPPDVDMDEEGEPS